MFDFLDKTGLKTVLEQIKAKFPSSLPANGGNADTVDGKHAADFVEAITNAQTATTRILIPNDVDVADWLIKNAKIGTVYYRTQYSTGQTNLPPIPDIAWAWFLFDGIRYFCKVMINDYSSRDFLLDNVNFIRGWKEISTTPIKSTTLSGTTDASGNLMLWAASENKIPICAILSGYCSSIFYYAPYGNYYVGVSDINRQAYSPNVPISGTVYYI